MIAAVFGLIGYIGSSVSLEAAFVCWGFGLLTLTIQHFLIIDASARFYQLQRSFWPLRPTRGSVDEIASIEVDYVIPGNEGSRPCYPVRVRWKDDRPESYHLKSFPTIEAAGNFALGISEATDAPIVDGESLAKLRHSLLNAPFDGLQKPRR
ncbi:hypothetical protein [Fimbriimonas ginsengisoli]|nr:hypothetical protein [Fimbriimonas ginsengisoli]